MAGSNTSISLRSAHVRRLHSWPIAIEFWKELHERLARLSNRIDAASHGKVLGAVHERIPMATPGEQAALQLQNAEADIRFWNIMHDMHKDILEENRQIIENSESAIAKSTARMAEDRARIDDVQGRIDRLKRGEAAAGGLTAMTADDVERLLGKEMVRRMRLLISP